MTPRDASRFRRSAYGDSQVDVLALVTSLRDGTAFGRGRFVAVTRELVAMAELRTGERRARDHGFDVKTRLIERAGILAVMPRWIGQRS